MKAMILVDNTPSANLRGEWGLSIYIEYKDRRILLDAGSTNLFLENAKELGCDIEAVDMAVLSHAHYDHGNGMVGFFTVNKNAHLYLQKAVKENCYKKVFLFQKYIGIPKKMTDQYADRIRYAEGDTCLMEGVWLIPHKTPGLEKRGLREQMYRKEGWRFIPDDFAHEQSLVIDTERGLVIFNSCCHGGADTVIKEVTDSFPDKQVYGLIGGFHLFNKNQEEVRDLAGRIKDLGIEYVCTGHCSGPEAYEILREELGDKLHSMQVGLEMKF